MITPAIASSLSVGRRTEFVGRTDKYMPSRPSPYSDINRDVGAVVSDTSDELSFLSNGALAAIYTEVYKEQSQVRLNRYREYVKFYKGEHWDNPHDDGEKKPVFNFCKIVVNKSVDFFCNKGFSVRSKEGETKVSKLLDKVWTANNKIMLARCLGAGGSLLGDSFLYVAIDTNDSTDRSKWSIRLNVLDAFFVYPVFDEKDPTVLSACTLRIPTGKKTEAGVPTFTMLAFTKDKIIKIDAEGKVVEDKNALGVVPVIHFPNYKNPITSWGESDIDGVVDLNKEYNTIMLSVRRIIKYHAEPTTVIYGVKASRLEKGAKKVWSGLPTEARVENLAYNADLGATYAYLDKIEDNIHKTAGIPAVLFQTERAVSHASGVAMKMLYQPILEKNERKTEAFNTAFSNTTRVLFEALKVCGMSVDGLLEEDETIDSIYAEFPDPLPYDEAASVDIDAKKLASRFVSLASLIRKYNPSRSLNDAAIEIISDKLSEVFDSIEKARGAKGEMPDMASVLTSSAALIDPSAADKITKLFSVLAEKAHEKSDSESDDTEDTDNSNSTEEDGN